MGELNVYGVYVPILLIQAVLAYVVLRVLMRVLDRVVEQGWIPLPNIFYLCMKYKHQKRYKKRSAAYP